MVEEGNLMVYNPGKEISIHITLKILVKHREAHRQAQTGELNDKNMEDINDNDRKIYQVRGLSLMIASQLELIGQWRHVVRRNNFAKWSKRVSNKDKTMDDFLKHGDDFDRFDYFDLMEIRDFLYRCRQKLIEAERTPTKDDDFIIEQNTKDGDVLYLTDNFYEMLRELEDSYAEIYDLLTIHKILGAGMVENDETTEKELEQLALNDLIEG